MNCFGVIGEGEGCELKKNENLGWLMLFLEFGICIKKKVDSYCGMEGQCDG